MVEFNTLEEYYNLLVEKVDNNDSSRFLNTDRAHNAVVMSVIFSNSNHVKMFCGELSIFEPSFADKVRESLKIEEDKNFAPMDKLYSSLEKFLSEKNHTLTIIIQNHTSTFLKESPVKSFLLNNEQVKIYVLNSNDSTLNIDHFTVGENRMYRREIDKDTHQAICCFNNIDGSQILLNTFEDLLKQSSILEFN